MKAAKEIIQLTKYGETLKRVNRTGWALAGVAHARPESVSEHSFGTALLSLLIAKELIQSGFDVDMGKVVSMAVIHDLPESITSDIPHTFTQIAGEKLAESKTEVEREAMTQIAKVKSNFQKWLFGLWTESEETETIESRIVNSADILDMLIHAVTLETSGVSPEHLDQFFISSRERLEKLDIPLVTSIFWEIYSEHYENVKRGGIQSVDLTKE